MAWGHRRAALVVTDANGAKPKPTYAWAPQLDPLERSYWLMERVHELVQVIAYRSGRG